jgi:protein-tyrosine-phosphatase
MKYVLFVCTHNAGRSQMAQAFFVRDCSRDCRCGIRRLAARASGLARGHRGVARGRDPCEVIEQTAPE